MNRIIHFLTALLLLALLAACAPTETTEPTSDETAAEGECEAGQRLFDHELLATDPVCIPETPERVVVLDFQNTAALLRADVPLVGAAEIDTVTLPIFPEYEAELSELTETGRPPNLEVILEAEPDLIITPSPRFEEAGEALTAIAPTIVHEFPPPHEFEKLSSLTFDAVGRLDAYDALMAEYETRLTEVANLIDNPEDIEVSLFTIGSSNIGTFTQFTGGGGVLSAIGFARPEEQLIPLSYEEFIENPDSTPEFVSWGGVREFSFERVDIADGDFIFIVVFASEEDLEAIYAERVEGNPLWQQLEAVQNGQIYLTNANFSGTDLAQVHGVLDAIAEAFGVADQISPNPYDIKAPMPELDMEADEETSN